MHFSHERNDDSITNWLVNRKVRKVVLAYLALAKSFTKSCISVISCFHALQVHHLLSAQQAYSNAILCCCSLCEQACPEVVLWIALKSNRFLVTENWGSTPQVNKQLGSIRPVCTLIYSQWICNKIISFLFYLDLLIGGQLINITSQSLLGNADVSKDFQTPHTFSIQFLINSPSVKGLHAPDILSAIVKLAFSSLTLTVQVSKGFLLLLLLWFMGFHPCIQVFQSMLQPSLDYIYYYYY